MVNRFPPRINLGRVAGPARPGGRVAWIARLMEQGRRGAGGRALQILAEGDRIRRITPHHHLVRSRTDGSRWYDVRQKGSRWSCSCADHLYRKAQCRHILAVMAQVAEREAAVLGAIAEPADQSDQSDQSGIHLHPVDCDHPGRCPGCRLSGQVIKWGGVYAAKGKTGRYRCGRCGRAFVRRGGFERMRKPDWAILRALNDFFKGHSPAAIADTLEGQGCRVHPATIYKWIAQFIRRVHAHLRRNLNNDLDNRTGHEGQIRPHFIQIFLQITMRTLPVRVGERFCADEVFGTASSRSCLFSVTDLVTRFRPALEMATRKDGHNTTALLEAAQDRAGKVPAEFVSDGLASYGQVHRAVFAAQTPLDKCSVHVSEAAIRNKKRNNNVQERFNGTFGASQGTRRGIKSAGSRLIIWLFVHYNFVRPHTAIGGRTPAQAAGITIHGPDKWRTITGNAALAAGAVP